MSLSSYYNPVASQSEATRKSFIRKTYFHLVASILIFASLCTAIINTGLGEIISSLFFGSNVALFITFAMFVSASYLANNWAQNTTSIVTQYLGLGLYIILEAIIFTPMLLFASYSVGVEIIAMAGFLTLFLTMALTFITFLNNIDFSFLNRFLIIGGFVAFGIIIASFLFGLSLGLWFSGIMIIFAGAAILRDTSNIMLHYQTHQYVAASLSLFASVALLFFYILRFLLQVTSRN